MPREIERAEVRRLRDEGAQLVEVLPVEEFKEDHLPGAISLPLRYIDREGVSALDKDRPVVVYCWDIS
jgi:phage shock protein E